MHNYTKHFDEKNETAEEVVEPVEFVEEAEAEKIQPTMGVVTECSKLRVRETPSSEGAEVAIIDFGEEVMVDLETSTDDFYKVWTAAGKEGYCMKQFIAV